MPLETSIDTDRGFRSTCCLAKPLQEEVNAFMLACEPAAIKGIHGKLETKAAAGFLFTLFLFLVNREGMEEAKKKAMVLLFLVVLSGGFCCVSAASPARLGSAFVSNLLSALLRRLWSLTPSTGNAILNRSSVKFESGYNVETVFDGSKLGIEPFSVGVMPSGDLLVVDSLNSNIYRVSLPLSKYSRPKLVAGSAEGYTGHVDGKPRAARMNHPKGLALDDKGNIYVADTKNKAIRKCTIIQKPKSTNQNEGKFDSYVYVAEAQIVYSLQSISYGLLSRINLSVLFENGVTTIAGGKSNKGGHVDGPSEDATFSNDFEVVYIGSSCSLLVVDRGNQAIREIQLHFDDCAYQYGAGFPLGIAMLFAAGFFGYMLAMLQLRWAVVVSSTNPMKSSLRPPLIPLEAEYAKHEEEEGLFTSVKKLVTGAGLSLSLMFSGIFLRKRSQSYHQDQQQQQRKANSWPLQESFIVPDEEPPPVEAQTPNQQRKTYAFMSKNPEKLQQLRYDRAYFNGWDGESQPQQHLQKHRQHSSSPQTYYEPTYETTDEVVFGAVKESDSKYDMAPSYDQYGPRYRVNYLGYYNDY
ncbi:NHL repeat-containing protein [Musa troglodytarum]|uniref:NHL repeat-containing protein n=1 Tax=Musa troglodytarum TaxID=320322 RepID=A0A9E7FHM0_9LILI|nr:NHL repeat-containing protein [Musa troglodytarum]